MRTAQAEVITIGGTPALAVERYDRTPTLDRVHQEDGCQATGAPAGWKYESEGGPSLAAIAGVLRDFAGVEDREQLLRRTTFNVVIGNADAHAKNLSIVHTRAGEIALAPLYDTCATVALRATNDQGIAIPNDPTMGQMIDGILDINRVRQANLIAEATRWGLRPQRARVVVEETIEAVLVAADRAPDWLGSLVRERAGAVRDG
jgi:serine/threonine-protein kinase HipA